MKSLLIVLTLLCLGCTSSNQRQDTSSEGTSQPDGYTVEIGSALLNDLVRLNRLTHTANDLANAELYDEAWHHASDALELVEQILDVLNRYNEDERFAPLIQTLGDYHEMLTRGIATLEALRHPQKPVDEGNYY